MRVVCAVCVCVIVCEYTCFVHIVYASVFVCVCVFRGGDGGGIAFACCNWFRGRRLQGTHKTCPHCGNDSCSYVNKPGNGLADKAVKAVTAAVLERTTTLDLRSKSRMSQMTGAHAGWV